MEPSWFYRPKKLSMVVYGGTLASALQIFIHALYIMTCIF
jgi:hypothetical protein